jgi:hypothetical protein
MGEMDVIRRERRAETCLKYVSVGVYLEILWIMKIVEH